MERRDALDRAVRILTQETDIAAEIITGRRQVTVERIAAVLRLVKHPDLYIPEERIQDMFRAVGQVEVDSSADAKSLVDALIRADNRAKGMPG